MINAMIRASYCHQDSMIVTLHGPFNFVLLALEKLCYSGASEFTDGLVLAVTDGCRDRVGGHIPCVSCCPLMDHGCK